MNKKTLLEKIAQAGVSEEDQKALMDFIKTQKAEAAKKELQKKNLRAQNRADRVFNAKVALTVILGMSGSYLGGFAGRRLGKNLASEITGDIAGGVVGGITGNLLGGYLGNRKADRMEREEDRTGVSVFDQNHRNMTRQLNNWYMWDNHGGHGLGYSLLTR